MFYSRVGCDEVQKTGLCLLFIQLAILKTNKKGYNKSSGCSTKISTNGFNLSTPCHDSKGKVN